MTNFEKIKAMTAEEYAEWHMSKFTVSQFCEMDCPDFMDSTPVCFVKCFRNWLESEVEDNAKPNL